MTDRERAVLVETARDLYRRGLMPGTSGNLSLRLDDGSICITPSSVGKGRFTADDVLHVSAAGHVLESRSGTRPSDETVIHLAVYRLFADARACFHVHTVESNVAARFSDEHGGDSLDLPPLEMLEGLCVEEEEPQEQVAIFRNHLRSADIAADVLARFEQDPPRVPGFLVRDHGFTTWGPTAEVTLDRVELWDYVFRYMVASRR